MPDSVLTRMYRELVAEAQGATAGRTLRNGARMAVRVRDGVQTVTFSRRDQPLGDVELDTFIRHCAIPVGAARIPAEGQGQIDDGGRPRHYVAFRWPLTSDMFAAEGVCDASS